MAFTTESPQGMEAGVAPLFMQQGYDAEQARKAAILKSLQGFNAPGQQNTIPSLQQLNTPVADIQSGIAQDKAFWTPEAKAKREAAASATDQAKFEAGKKAYLLEQAQKELIQQQAPAQTNWMDKLRAFGGR